MIDLARDRLVRRALAIFAISRAIGLAAVAYAAWLEDASFARALKVWDGYWYLQVIEHGYPSAVDHPAPFSSGIVAFFPGFPLLARAVATITRLPDAAAAYVVVLVAGAVAVVGLALLVRRLDNDRSALRTVALFCFFPGAYTLSLLYSEALMVAAVVVCFLALYNRRWMIAGVAGAVASFSRPTGIAVAVACAWEALRAIRSRGEWRALWATLLAPFGVAAYFLYLWRHTGEARIYLRVQREVWLDQVSFGDGIRDTLTHTFDSVNLSHRLILVAGLAFIVVAGVLLARSRLPLSMKLYTAAVLVLPVLMTHVGARPRYVFVAFPLTVAVAQRLSSRAFAVLLTLSGTAMVLLLVVHIQRSPEFAPFLYPISPSP